jgi:hypothetical protein
MFLGGPMFYLRYLSLFVYSGVQHILCSVFVFFFFVLCTLYCQFLLFWQCGIVLTVWDCSDSVGLLTVWNCSDSVALFWQCGIGLTVWHCSDSVVLFLGGLMSYLRYLSLFVYSGVQHILCSVFVFFFFVLCTLYCQFLWIVLFWLPLRYSPKCI